MTVEQDTSLAIQNLANELNERLDEIRRGVGLAGLFSIDVSGNAATADKFKTTRQIGLSGDLTGSAAFDGSSDLNISVALANVLPTGGTYNSATQISSLTFDRTGRVVSVGSPVLITPDWTSVQNRPTTLAGYGIVDAARKGANSDITSLSGLTTALSAAQGGTGFSSYAVGDLLYASSPNTLARLASVDTGNVLLSEGQEMVPRWGKVVLSTHVAGILPMDNGGTGASTPEQARQALGLRIGSDVQAYSANLDALGLLTGEGYLKRTAAGGWLLEASAGGGTGGSTGPVSHSGSVGVVGDPAANRYAVRVISSGSANAALIQFERSGEFAAYLGLDTDNKLKFGGYSLGLDAFELVHTGNLQTLGIVTATGGAVESAQRLSTPRLINGVAFDGTQDITVPTTALSNALSAGNYLVGGTFDGSSPATFAVDATTTATANKVVARNSSGGVVAVSYQGQTSLTLDSSSAVNNGIILGSSTNATYPYLNFRSSGLNSGYDASIRASGGTSVVGKAKLSYLAAEHEFQGNVKALQNLTITGNLTVLGNLSASIPPVVRLNVPDYRGSGVTPLSKTLTGLSADLRNLSDVDSPNAVYADGLALVMTVDTSASAILGYPVQIALGKSLSVRQGLSDTTWGAWAEVLDSSNYSLYAPGLQGAGATGLWDISITGNAASATSLLNARCVQSEGISAEWGADAGTQSGAFNAVMPEDSGATWLLSGTQNGVFKAGIQAANTDGALRFYQGSSFFSFSSDTLSATNLSGRLNASQLFSGYVPRERLSGTYDINVTGAAAQAAALSVARTIAVSGAVAGSAVFDGRGDINIDTALASIGVAAGTYGGSGLNPKITINDKGQVIAVEEVPNAVSIDDIQDKPSTLDGYGITDALNKTSNEKLPLENAIITSATITTPAGGPTQVADSFDSTMYCGAKYMVQITSGVAHHLFEALVVHDGDNAFITVYGEVKTRAALATVDVDIHAGQVRLLLTPVNVMTVVRVLRVSMLV